MYLGRYLWEPRARRLQPRRRRALFQLHGDAGDRGDLRALVPANEQYVLALLCGLHVVHDPNTSLSAFRAPPTHTTKAPGREEEHAYLNPV